MQERPATRRIGVAETSDRVEPVANSARNPHRHAVRSQYGYATTMLRLNRRQRDVLADKVPEVANIIMGAVVVAFAIGDFSASPAVLVGAFSFWASALTFALWVMKTRR
jgi:Flp pilus assembly protein TadB